MFNFKTRYLDKLLTEYSKSINVKCSRILTISKNSSFSDDSISSLSLTSELESSLEEVQSEKSLNSSDKTNFELKQSSFVSQDALQSEHGNKFIREDDLKNDQVDFENTNEQISNATEILSKGKIEKQEFLTSKICPNCELSKKLDVNTKSLFIIRKDLFIKILIFIMLVVIFLNYILYVKLSNLEEIANRLAVHKKLNQNVEI